MLSFQNPMLRCQDEQTRSMINTLLCFAYVANQEKNKKNNLSPTTKTLKVDCPRINCDFKDFKVNKIVCDGNVLYQNSEEKNSPPKKMKKFASAVFKNGPDTQSISIPLFL